MFHITAQARDLVTRLAPYDFNVVELTWAKMKRHLRPQTSADFNLEKVSNGKRSCRMTSSRKKWETEWKKKVGFFLVEHYQQS